MLEVLHIKRVGELIHNLLEVIKIKKILTTLTFYYKKAVRIVDTVLENTVKSIETIAAKVPQLINDIYGVFIHNLNVNSIIALALGYIVYANYIALFSNPTSLIVVLIGIVLLLKK